MSWLSNFFKGPKVKYEEVGAWPGAKGFGGNLMGTLSPYIPQAGTALGSSMDLWGRTTGGEFLDVTEDPILMNAVRAALGPAEDYFGRQQRELGAKFIKSGNVFSSARQEEQTRLGGQQSQQLADMIWGILAPVAEQRRAEMYAASEMPLRTIDLFRTLATAGKGETVPIQYGQSPFSQALELAAAGAGVGLW